MSLAEFRPSWQQTMLRIKDPKVSIPFYEALGFQVLVRHDFPDWKFTVFFLVIPHPKSPPLPTDAKERELLLMNYNGVALELTHNHGTELDKDFKYHNGNSEPRGFGHIALHCDDVYATSAELEARGVIFKKRPDEGRMKGLAFILDPDGYMIELVRRTPGSPWNGIGFSLAQTMLRVKDPKPALAFYTGALGMKLMHERHFGPDEGDFSLYFLQDASQGEAAHSANSHDHTNACFHPVLELTHNHGTEADPDFHYHDGNSEPRGFGHLGFLVDNIDGFFARAEESGLRIKKRPSEGMMRCLGFLYDSDNYWIEIIQRGATIDMMLGK